MPFLHFFVQNVIEVSLTMAIFNWENMQCVFKQKCMTGAGITDVTNVHIKIKKTLRNIKIRRNIHKTFVNVSQKALQTFVISPAIISAN